MNAELELDVIAFYGSLMAQVAGETEARLTRALKFKTNCLIPGRIHDLGDYPGLVSGAGQVVGELYAINDHAILNELDAFERFYEFDRPNSLYWRESVRLIEPNIEAWVYVYNRDCRSAPLVQSGDWKTYWQEKKSS